MASSFVSCRTSSPRTVLHHVMILLQRSTFQEFCYWSKLVNGIAAELRRRGITEQLVLLDDSQPVPLTANAFRDVDGIVLVGSLNDSNLQPLLHSSLPIVWADNPTNYLACDTVRSDNVGAAYRMAELIAQKGHRRIIAAGMIQWAVSYKERYEGLCSFAKDNPQLGLEIFPTLKPLRPKDAFFHHDEMKELLLQPNPPTAVFCVCDSAATMVYKLATECGLHIPSDLSVTGFDNVREYNNVVPPLTTVNVSKIGLAIEAVCTLEHRARHPDEPLQHNTVPTDIVLRDSLAECPFR